MTYKQQLLKRVRAIDAKLAKKNHFVSRYILSEIVKTQQSQDALARKLVKRYVAYHGQQIETTKRQVRDMVMSLRRDYRAPILSNRRGYYIPDNDDDVRRRIEEMRHVAKSRIQTTMLIVRSVEEAFNIQQEKIWSEEK